MSSTAPNLADDLKEEFDHMNNQDYPYNMQNNKNCVIANLINSSPLPVDITSTTKLMFDTYQYEFYPYLSDGTVQMPGATVIPGPTPQDPPTIIPSEMEFIFETSSTGTLPITSSDVGHIYINGTLVTTLAVQNTDCITADNEALYYFTYRITKLFMDNINSSGINDPGTEEDPGAGLLSVSFSMMENALSYGWVNILSMQSIDPNEANNSKITNTLDTYLDKLTGNYFYNTHAYSYQPVRTMSGNACAALDNMSLSTTPNAATIMSAEMMADVLDYYCNGGIS